jgi:predicted methyltransferase
MNIRLSRLAFAGVFSIASLLNQFAFADDRGDLQAILQGTQRSTEHKQLDKVRDVKQLIDFLQIKPNQKVIEIWPGDGWYSEILAPYLKSGGGAYTVAVEPGNTEQRKKRNSAFLNKLADDSDTYSEARLITFTPASSNIRPVGGVDLVLSNGNVATWLNEGTADSAFSAFFLALKSAGTLAIINAPDSGISKPLILDKAQLAGFQFVAEQPLGQSGEVVLRFSKPANAPVPNDVVTVVSKASSGG